MWVEQRQRSGNRRGGAARWAAAGAIWLALAAVAAAVNVYWRNDAHNGDWDFGGCHEQGDGSGPHWYYNEWSPNNSRGRPDCFGYHIVHFDNNNQLSMTLNGGSWYDAHQILFESSTGARTISGSNGIDMRDAGAKIENNVSAAHVFNVPIAFNSGPTEINPISGGLTFHGTIFLKGNWLEVWGDNGHTLNLFGVLDRDGGDGGVAVKQNSTVVITNNNTFTGSLAVEKGTVRLQGHTNAVGASGTVLVGTNATLELNQSLFWRGATLNLSGFGTAAAGGAIYSVNGSTWPGNISLDNDSRIRAAGSSFNTRGTISANSFTLYVTNSAIFDMLAGELSGSKTSGDGALDKDGTNRFLLRPASGLTGSITLRQGEIRQGSGNSSLLPAGGLLILSDGVTYGSDGTTARTVAKDVRVDGGVTLNGTGGQGALMTYSGGVNLNGVTRTLTATNAIVSGAVSNGGLTKAGNGPLTLAGANTHGGDTRVSAGSLILSNANALAQSTLDMNSGDSGAVTFGAPSAFTLGGLTGARDLNLNGKTVSIGNNNANTTYSGELSNGALTKIGTGFLTLSGVSTYTGATTVDGGTLRMGGANRLSASTAVSVSGGATFDLDGNNTEVGSIAGAGNYTLGSGALTAGGNNGNTEVSGTISGAGSLTKVGSGTLTLTGPNTYAGGSTVSAGTLAGTTDGLQGHILNNAAVIFSQNVAGSYGGALSGSGTLSKQGTGRITFTGTNVHSGASTISAGALIVNGPMTNTALTVQSGSTLGGHGPLGPVAVSGAVSPGESVTNLLVDELTLEQNGRYVWDLGAVAGAAGTDWDLITVSNGLGTVTVNATAGNRFVIDVSSMGATPTGWDSAESNQWLIIDAGSVSGFDTGKFVVVTTNFTPAFSGSWRLSEDSGQVYLLYVPPLERLVWYPFTGDVANPSNVAANVSATAMGISQGSITYGTANAASWTGTSGVPYAIGSTTWTATLQSIAKNFNFTLIGTNGWHYSIEEIRLWWRRTSAGPPLTGLRIDSTSVHSQSLAADTTQQRILPISGYPSQTTAVFRIDGWNDGSTTGSGQLQLDDVEVYGRMRQFPLIGLDTNDLLAVTNLGHHLANGSFAVTNAGGGLLSYVISTNVDWLTISPVSATNRSSGQSATHTITYDVAGLALGVHTAVVTVAGTGAGVNQAYNSPQTFRVIVTIERIADPADTQAVADGAEAVDLAWTPTGGNRVLIVRRGTNAPTARPTDGVSYEDGDAIGGGVVILTTNSPAAIFKDTELGPGVETYFVFYNADQFINYSGGATSVATTATYDADEIVDPFSYITNHSVGAKEGGFGWTNAWSATAPAPDQDVVIQTNRFPDFSATWPAQHGHRMILKTTNGALYAVRRGFEGVTCGQLYVGAIMRYQFTGVDADGKFAGISLYDGDTEEVFFGEVGAFDQNFGVEEAGTANRNVSGGFVNNTDFLILGKYDFDTGLFQARRYISTDVIPAGEPGWDVSISVSLSRLDGLRLAAGAAVPDQWPGEVPFDEVRVARTWGDLMRLYPPRLTNYLVGANNVVTDADMLSGNFDITMHIDSRAGVETVETTPPFFPPNFDLISPVGVEVLSDETFDTFSYLSGTQVEASDASHPISYADIVLGVYTGRLSAINSNQATTINSTYVPLCPDRITFTVVDDDTDGPVVGAPSYPASMVDEGTATVTVAIHDAYSQASSNNSTLFYGYSAPYNQSSVGVSGGNGNGDFTFRIPPQPGRIGQTLCFYLVGGDDDNDRPDDAARSTNDNGGAYFCIEVRPPPVIRESFGYSAGSLHDQLGLAGWTNAWANTAGALEVSTFNLSPTKCYPAESGNKARGTIHIGPFENKSVRRFPEMTSGLLYASYVLNFQFGSGGGANKFAGLSFMDGGTESLYFGARDPHDGSGTLRLGFDGGAVPTATNSPFTMDQGNVNYHIFFKYDFDARIARAKAWRVSDNNILAAEFLDIVWDTIVTNVSLDRTDGVQIGMGASSGGPGEVNFDEIRIGTNWHETMLCGGVNDTDREGPVPVLRFIGVSYDDWAAGPQADKTSVLDAELADTDNPIDFAVYWSDPSGVFLTNDNPAANTKDHIGAEAGRVLPNWDPLSVGAVTNPFNLDEVFTDFAGYNGAPAVTTIVRGAFSITNFDDTLTYYITVSGEDDDQSGICSTPDSHPDHGRPAGNDVWCSRALTINSQLVFTVTDDDATPPEFANLLVAGTGASMTRTSELVRFTFETIANQFDTNATVIASALTDLGFAVSAGTLPTITGNPGLAPNAAGGWGPTSKYYRFVVVVDSNFQVAVTNISFDSRATTTGPNQWYLKVRQGTVTQELANGRTITNAVFSFTTATVNVTGLAGTNEFQLYAGTDNGAGGGGNWAIDNLKLFGQLAPAAGAVVITDQDMLEGAYSITGDVRDVYSGVFSNKHPDLAFSTSYRILSPDGATVVAERPFQFGPPTNGAAVDWERIVDLGDTPAVAYADVVLGVHTAWVSATDFDNDRLLDSLTGEASVTFTVIDDDTEPPEAGPNLVAAMLGGSGFNPLVSTQLLAGWNFNDSSHQPAFGAGLMTNNLAQTNTFGGGTTSNLVSGDVAGSDLTIPVGAGAVNNGRFVQYEVGMSGYQNLVVSLAVQRSNTGFFNNQWSWSTNGVNFTAFGADFDSLITNAVRVITHELASVPALNNQARVYIRLTLGGGTAGGNIRLDNIQFNAEPIRHFDITDGQLAAASVADPLLFSFNLFDFDSGIPRGTDAGQTNLRVTLDGVTTNNTAQYDAARSSAGTQSADSTSVWAFTSFGYDHIGHLYANGLSNRFIRATAHDADNDRLNDNAWVSNQFFGTFRVIDDDAAPPFLTNIVYGEVGVQPNAIFWVVTNNARLNGNIRGTARREGIGLDAIWAVTDDELARPETHGLQFAFGVRDAVSQPSRGAAGDTNSVLNFSIGSVYREDFANFSAALSGANGTNLTTTNVWVFPNGTFSSDAINSLLASAQHTVRLTMMDNDDDRPADGAITYLAPAGFLRVRDDDISALAVRHLQVESNAAIGAASGFENEEGWQNFLAYGEHSHTDGYGTWHLHNMLANTLNEEEAKRTQVRKLHLRGDNNGETWLQPPPVDNPGVLFAWLRNSSGGATNFFTADYYPSGGTGWINTEVSLPVSTTAFTRLAFPINFEGNAVTVRLYSANIPTPAAVYVDDVSLTRLLPWTNSVQVQVNWIAPTGELSGILEYRVTNNASRVPEANTDGVAVAAAVTNTAVPTLAEGFVTGYVFMVDADDDRAGDGARGMEIPFVTRIDRTPPIALTITNAKVGADEFQEINLGWDPAPDPGDHPTAGALSPWDSYIIYLTDDGTPPATNNYTDLIRNLHRSELGDIDAREIVISNLSFGTDYRLAVVGLDRAGNQSPISMVATVVLEGFILTQGYHYATSETNVARLAWTAGNDPITREFDLIYVDSSSTQPGFHPSLTSQWALVETVSDSYTLDGGAVDRIPPTDMGNRLRFYRASRQGRWTINNQPRLASRAVYVAKTLQLSTGENWVSLFFEPDSNTVARIFGTNSLPSGGSLSESTIIEWYGATDSGGATNTIWLDTDAGWVFGGGGLANHYPVPLDEGFNIIIPEDAGNQKLMVIGRVPTNITAEAGHVHTLRGGGYYNVVSYNLPYRVLLTNSGLREAGFTGAPLGTAVNPNNSDELRILQRGGGSLVSPATRILMNGDRHFVHWPGGEIAEHHMLRPDDALIIYTRVSTGDINWTLTLPYPVPNQNMSP